MKWAIREAVDVYFKAKSPLQLGARMIRAGEPILIFDTVQTSAFEVAAEISYVTGGRGNARILSFEGDKTLTFNFEEALLSDEGLALLAGADLIPARNIRLPGASPNAKTVITHFTEKYAVEMNNVRDSDPTNQFPYDTSLFGPEGTPQAGNDYSPRGGRLNVWLSKKPYVGQNASIYVALMNRAGEMSGAPLQINLDNTSRPKTAATPVIEEEDVWRRAHIASWEWNDAFIAVDTAGNPMRFRPKSGVANPTPAEQKHWPHPCSRDANAVFDDQVAHYVDVGSMADNWLEAWGDIRDYIRHISARSFGDGRWGDMKAAAPGGHTSPQNIIPEDYVRRHEYNGNFNALLYVRVFDSATGTFQNQRVNLRDMVLGQVTTPYSLPASEPGSYGYLLAPSGGRAQPKAFREGNRYVYKINVPSILFQDIVHLDYYVEHRRHATQVSILPEKFGPFVYVEGASLVRRASDGVDLPVTFVIPKFKITTQLTFTMASTGDASTFDFAGDAYPDFSKFDLTRRVLADIQIVDDTAVDGPIDPTDYRRFEYVEGGGEYLWKDPSMPPHDNIDYADTLTYRPEEGGPATRTPGLGLISVAEQYHSGGNRPNNPRGEEIMGVCYGGTAQGPVALQTTAPELHVLQTTDMEDPKKPILVTNHDIGTNYVLPPAPRD